MTTLAQTFTDGAVITKRNLLKIKRVPELLVFSTLSPIMFVLLFAFVFGSAIPLPGVDYKTFLMAGIFTQTVIFGGTVTGVSIAEDLQKGLIDRFRSLPMARSAVLVGRTNADIGNNIVVLIVMSLTGLLVGWRITTSVGEALLAYLLLLLFAYSISWMFATIGLLVKAPEVVNNAGFIVIFPLTFIANTFVPTTNFPPVLKTIADWNPVSSVTQCVRELYGNTSPALPPPDNWAGQNPMLYSLIWIGVFLAVFVPVSVRLYVNAAGK